MFKQVLGVAVIGVQLLIPVLAADSDAALEEVVVTATRRSERLQDVPISVSAISQEKIDAQGLRNIDDISRLTPGIAFQRNGMSSAGNYNDEGSDINIRGIDSTAGTSTTGIYIDDTPIQTRHVGFGSVNPFPALFDLDRVEVLRGPQGTLFGAGAEGGVVRFIAPEPNLEKVSAYARAETGFTDGGSPSYEGGVAFGAPLIEGKLAFRASISYRRDGGWVDRDSYTLNPPGAAATLTGALTPTPIAGPVTSPNANYSDTTTARLALKWQVTDALSITPSIYYQRLQLHDTAAYWIALSNPSNNTYYNGNALTNPSDDPFTLTAVKVQWDLGFASLFSNTAYLNRNQKSQSDYTQYLRATWSSPVFASLANTFPEAGDGGYATFKNTQRNAYEELRLASNDKQARISWNAGLFASHTNESVPENIIDPTLNTEVTNYTTAVYGTAFPVCSTALPCPNGLIFAGPVDSVAETQLALFGDVDFKITDTLKATLGMRVSKIDYRGRVSQTGPFLGTTIIQESGNTDKPWTPKAVISWQPNRDELIYASASKGFRPGGPNVGVGAICAGDLTALGLTQVPGKFSADNLWSYEIGAKNTLFDHRLQINASLFYVDWRNIQQNVYLPSCGEQFTANLGKAKSEGGDLEILYKPLENLSLDFTAAYTDARLTRTSCAGSLTYNGSNCVNDTTTDALPVATVGDALLGAPWSFTASAEYRFPAWQEYTPYARMDFQYTTAQKSLLQGQDQRNALFDATLPGLPVTHDLSLRAGMRVSGFDVSVYANNVTNAHPLLFEARDIASADPTLSTDNLYFGRGVRPRTIGVTATYRY